ncbi:Tweety [Dictyocaulus viviparus]|uniref:Protein tweety homolog n=1 Tax=Dictyocaulus viviparus TaxID=29172 RepID=A0A0D8XC20_DICVI|nr:Tweety [Dictyocaulus viviparus]
MLDVIISIFNYIPHFNFHFERIPNSFDINWRSDYAQSIVIIAAICCIITILLLLTIVITWICQCCSSEETTGKSRRKVRRLSILLFSLSVLCFIFLGLCLFGNEHVNRGMTKSISGLADVNRGFKLAIAQTNRLNDTCEKTFLHLKSLEDIIHVKGKSLGINGTLLEQMDSVLISMASGMNLVTKELKTLQKTLVDVSFLESAEIYGERIELERWMLLVTLLSIMMCVLFAGVISFCRQSKKGAIVFSGLGIVIFLVVWTLLCFVLPLAVVLVDFCSSGGQFIRSKINYSFLSAMEYYQTCDTRLTHDNVPPILSVTNISDILSAFQTNGTSLNSLLDATFSRDSAISKSSAVVADDSIHSLKSIGALESALACYAYKQSVRAMSIGMCNQAIIGSSILTFCLIFLGILLFTLLLIVSRSWNLFSRLPSDYVEVDEDDPFFPRTNDSMIPVDIYGTHVFNPRTRDRAEPSTNTTTVTGNLPGEEQTVPLWNTINAPSIPNSTRTHFNENSYGNYMNNRYDV